MTSEDYREVCELLDKIYLDSVCLMEEDIRTKIDMEKAMIEGENNLAKCRYIMGSNSVSAMNIPLNPEENIFPLVTVESSPDEVLPEVNKYELVSADEGEKRIVNPSKWFGLFTHRMLLNSQNYYKKSLELAIQSVNIQKQLTYLCNKYEYLSSVKFSLAEFKDEK